MVAIGEGGATLKVAGTTVDVAVATGVVVATDIVGTTFGLSVGAGGTGLRVRVAIGRGVG